MFCEKCGRELQPGEVCHCQDGKRKSKRIILIVVTIVTLMGIGVGAGWSIGGNKIKNAAKDNQIQNVSENVEENNIDDATSMNITETGNNISNATKDNNTDTTMEPNGYMYATQGTMEGNVIIRPKCKLLLKNDGTVVGKGDSSFGELGNGGRNQYDHWTPVLELKKVKRIYADTRVGATDDERERKHAFCYALTEDGNLYRWGGNILTPQIWFQNITDFYRCGAANNGYIIRFSDGTNKVLAEYDIMRLDKILFDFPESLEKYDVLYANRGPSDSLNVEMILKDRESGMGYWTHFDIQKNERINEKDYIYNAIATEDKRYELGDDVESFACNSLDTLGILSDSGTFSKFYVSIIDGDITFYNDYEGSGFKDYIEMGDWNTFALQDSKILTKGKNDSGQLGDGTSLDYYDDWIVLGTSTFTELYAGRSESSGSYCVALDSDNNIWGWGGNYVNKPTILVPAGLSEDNNS